MSEPSIDTPRHHLVDNLTLERWKREQECLKDSLLLRDVEDWQKLHELPVYVAGVDISFRKTNVTIACAALVVCKLPTLEVVYEDLEEVEVLEPYIPGYLGFREVEPLLVLLQKLKDTEYLPQLLLVDGNGILHPNGFGVASHLGVLADIPSVGVAKKLFHIDGLENSPDHKQKIRHLQQGGDTFPLAGQKGETLGVALRGCDAASNVIYISQGHKISLDTAVWVVKQCCLYRIPEPIRQADIKSRDYLRQRFPGDYIPVKARKKDNEEGELDFMK